MSRDQLPGLLPLELYEAFDSLPISNVDSNGLSTVSSNDLRNPQLSRPLHSDEFIFLEQGFGLIANSMPSCTPFLGDFIELYQGGKIRFRGMTPYGKSKFDTPAYYLPHSKDASPDPKYKSDYSDPIHAPNPENGEGKGDILFDTLGMVGPSDYACKLVHEVAHASGFYYDGLKGLLHSAKGFCCALYDYAPCMLALGCPSAGVDTYGNPVIVSLQKHCYHPELNPFGLNPPGYLDHLWHPDPEGFRPKYDCTNWK
jgi:hypothetical protein